MASEALDSDESSYTAFETPDTEPGSDVNVEERFSSESNSCDKFYSIFEWLSENQEEDFMDNWKEAIKSGKLMKGNIAFNVSGQRKVHIFPDYSSVVGGYIQAIWKTLSMRQERCDRHDKFCSTNRKNLTKSYPKSDGQQKSDAGRYYLKF